MKIKITEEKLLNIIKESINDVLSEDFDLFGNEFDSEAESKKELSKLKNKNRAKKAAETRRMNKEKKFNELNRLHSIARSDGDLFGNKYSKEEQEDALNKLKKGGL